MKKYILVFFISLPLCLFSQYEIQYDYTSKHFVGDNLSSAITLKTYLYTDGIHSKFVKNRVINGKNEVEHFNADSEFLALMQSIARTDPGDSIGEVVIKNNYNDSVFVRLHDAPRKKYIKFLDTNVLEVELIHEFKMIENYNCQKAIIKNEFRTFEVWFTNEIAIHDGPWKLKGVPGLILYAESSDRRHEFKLTSMKKTTPFSSLFFQFPYDKEMDKATFIKEYLDAKERRFKYGKSKNEEGTTSKLTVDNLEMPITNFE